MCICCHNRPALDDELLPISLISSFISGAIVTVNVLALYGYFSNTTIGIINAATFGSIALSFNMSFCINFNKLGADKQVAKAFSMTFFVIFTVIAGLTSLGIPQIFSARTVAWIALPYPALLFLSSSTIFTTALSDRVRRACR